MASAYKPNKRKVINIYSLFVVDSDDIKRMAAAHTEEKPVDFSFHDLSSSDELKGLDLTGASFTCADCFDLDLSGCVLVGCDFSRAVNLHNVNFYNATMDRATADTIRDGGGFLPSSVNIIDEVKKC